MYVFYRKNIFSFNQAHRYRMCPPLTQCSFLLHSYCCLPRWLVCFHFQTVNLFSCRTASMLMLIWRFCLRCWRMSRWNHTSRHLCFCHRLCSGLRWDCQNDSRLRIGHRRLRLQLRRSRLLRIFWYPSLQLGSWRAHLLSPVDKSEHRQDWKTLIYPSLLPTFWIKSAWSARSKSSGSYTAPAFYECLYAPCTCCNTTGHHLTEAPPC